VLAGPWCWRLEKIPPAGIVEAGGGGGGGGGGGLGGGGGGEGVVGWWGGVGGGVGGVGFLVCVYDLNLHRCLPIQSS